MRHGLQVTKPGLTKMAPIFLEAGILPRGFPLPNLLPGSQPPQDTARGGDKPSPPGVASQSTEGHQRALAGLREGNTRFNL